MSDSYSKFREIEDKARKYDGVMCRINNLIEKYETMESVKGCFEFPVLKIKEVVTDLKAAKNG